MELPKRKRIRLEGFDYASSGGYFVTMCLAGRRPLLWEDGQGRGANPEAPPTLSRMVQQFKGTVTKRVGFSIWQKSFYDHVIRNDESYLGVWRYIDENPLQEREP